MLPMDDSRATPIEETVMAFTGEAARRAPRTIRGCDELSTLGLDSVEILKILIRLEARFEIVIGDDTSDFERIKTVDGLTRLVREKVDAANRREPEEE
jgi:acyl carrier protein